MADADSLQRISSQLERGEISSAHYLRQLAIHLAGHFESSRAGVWFFVDTSGGRVLRCAALYDKPQDDMLSVTDIACAGTSPYFEALVRDGCVLANDARSHPATVEFAADYLAPFDVAAKLDVGFSVNGVLVGVFSCEQLGTTRTWTQKELQSLRQISSHAGLALLRAATRVVDTAPGARWSTGNADWLATLPSRLPP